MNEFIYNTADVVAQTATPPEQQLAGYPLCDQRDSILTTKLKDFDFNDTTLNPEEIASRLIATCKYHKIYGIAANQCGLKHKVLVAGAEDNWVAFFNPVIDEYFDEVMLQESDLSNMGLVLSVKRPKSITIVYQDFAGGNKVMRLEGLTARIVQQGIDRLNGIDFKTLVSKFVLERAEKALEKKIKKFVRSQMIIKK
jgi:peptide deformylase